MCDLENHPGETRNVFGDPRYREDRAGLTEEILSWLIATEQPFLWKETLYPVSPLQSRWFTQNPDVRHDWDNEEPNRIRE